MARLIKFLARHHARLTWAVILSALLPAAFLPRLSINNAIEVWLPQGSPERLRYDAFTKRYGSEEFVVIAMETADALSPASLAAQRQLSDALGRIGGVDDVLSLSQFEGLVSRAPHGSAALRDGGFLRRLLVGEDGKTVGAVVWLRQLPGPSARRKVVEEIERAADRIGGAARTHLAGTPLMNVALDRASQRASMIFLPLAVVASLIMLTLMLRSVWGVLAVTVAVGVTVVWTMGLVAMSGRTLNMVTVTIPSLMFALALSNGIHLASEFSAVAALGDRKVALWRTLSDLVLPAFLTAITTAIGFGSLAISNMAPVTELGLFSAAGIMIGFVCTLIVVPGLLALVPGRLGGVARANPPHWTERAGPAAARRPWLMMAIALALLAVFATGARRIRTESNVLKFFPEDSRIARDYRFIGQRLTGFYTVELDVAVPMAASPAAQDAIERLSRAIEQRPEVARVDHLGRVEAFGKAALRGGVGFSPASAARFFKLRARYVHDEGSTRHLRVSALVRAMDSSQFYGLLRFIREQAARDLPRDSQWVVTGVVPLLNDAQAALVHTQVNTFLLAAGVILAVIGLIFRSWRVMLIVIPSNLVPIAGTFALMGWSGIPLDAATVMIASIAIGIAIDNAVHFLSRYRQAIRGAAHGAPEAAGAAFGRMGRAAVFTSVVAAVGFSVLALARFRPIAEFGLLEGFTMITSLAGDLFLLPPSANLMGVWKKR